MSVAAALTLTFAGTVAAFGQAASPAGAQHEKSEGEDKPAHTRIDSSVSMATTGSIFGAVTGTFAPLSTIDQSGVRLRLDGLAGSYRTAPSDSQVARRETTQQGSALVGYSWNWENASLELYLGGELDHNPNDPVTGQRGTVAGFQGALDFYANPTEKTMAAASVSLSTTSNYFVQLKAGYAALAKGFVGPEIIFVGETFSREQRFGAHVSSVKVGPLELGVSGGFSQDHARGPGAYGQLTLGAKY